MKKYFFSITVALIIGFFLSSAFLKQYNDYNGIKVNNIGENLYFIQYGVFSTLESMEENTISLENYIYNIDDNKYFVYIGITKNLSNKNKIINYFESLGYKVIVKEYGITNKEFLNLLDNYDSTLKSTDDKTAISSIINQVLIKYEEVVINGNQN